MFDPSGHDWVTVFLSACVSLQSKHGVLESLLIDNIYSSLEVQARQGRHV